MLVSSYEQVQSLSYSPFEYPIKVNLQQDHSANPTRDYHNLYILIFQSPNDVLVHIHECTYTRYPFEAVRHHIQYISCNYHTFFIIDVQLIFCCSPNTTTYFYICFLIYFVDKSMFQDEKTLMLYFYVD